MNLRDYQREAVDGVFDAWKTNRSTLVVQATGTGKTVLAAEVIRRCRPKRTLVLAHRAELIYQFKEKVEKYAGLDCAIEMASERSDRGLFERSPVVVSSIQTQYSNNNSRAFKPTDFDVLVVDEAHHFLAPAYRRIIDHYLENPNLKVLGLTATPKRTDEIALGEIFQSVAATFETEDAIKAGYLVDIRQLFVPVGSLDYSHIRSTCGDLNQAELARVLEQEENIQGMIQPILEIGWSVSKDRLKDHPVSQWESILRAEGKPHKTIVFCASVAQAEAFSHILNRVIDGQSDFVSESTPKDKRRDILKRFAESETLRFVSNVGILGEGYDNPRADIIVMARATESLIVYQQALGRATRPLPGVIDGLETAEERRLAISWSQKQFATIVDFVGNSGRHKLISAVNVLGGKSSDEVLSKAAAKAKTDSKAVSVLELITQTEEAEEQARLERLRQEQARKSRIVAKVDYQTREISPFEAFDLHPCRPRGWDNSRRISEKQRLVLTGMGLSDPQIDALHFSQQKQLIDEHFRRKDGDLCSLVQARRLAEMGKPTNVSALEAAKETGVAGCTEKQAKALRRSGYDPRLFTVKTASEKIDELQKNGWKRPAANDETPSEPNQPAPHLTEKEVNWLTRYHYKRSMIQSLPVKEGRRLRFRIVQNGFKPLAGDDPDHPKNYRSEPALQL